MVFSFLHFCFHLFSCVNVTRSRTRLWDYATMTSLWPCTINMRLIYCLSIRRSVSRPVDYGNATLAGIPQHLLWRLQSVMNAAARLIYLSSRFDLISPLLRKLHWLQAKERIDFKLAVHVFKCVHRSAPKYFADEPSHPADSQARCRLYLASLFILVALKPVMGK